MFTLSTTHVPATDLGYLLHKNPNRVHEADLTFGKARVVFPKADESSCTVAVLVEVDPVNLVRGKGEQGGSLAQYVNDRPYVASSFVSVAIAEMFGTAMSGRSKERPELATTAIPIQVRIPVLPCRSGEVAIRELFEPLGYEVEVRRHPLDDQFSEWGESRYYDIHLSTTQPVSVVLRQLYVLLPVLDASKHYYMEKSEVEKLLTKGEGWLPAHPKKNWIVRSYLGRKTGLIRDALEQLANVEPELQVQEAQVDEQLVVPDEAEKTRARSLHDLRHDRIVELVRQMAPRSVIDLGCGEGRLMAKMVPIKGLEKIVGMDVAYYELEKAERRLHLEDATPARRERISLIHGSLMYRDDRIAGFDAAAICEVIEHLDTPRLAAFERVVFECAKPRAILLTSPNREYNAVFGDDEEFRHADHRFEWTRAEFSEWAERVAGEYGYRVRIEGVGPEHTEYGAPSQLAVFER